jgi:signal transduction histidine kinase
MRTPLKSPIVPWFLILAFILPSGGIGLTGYWYYTRHKRQVLEDRANELKAVADFKADSVANWRNELRLDAEDLQDNPFILGLLPQWLKPNPDPKIQQAGLTWMKGLLQRHHYASAMLLDPQGAQRLGVGDEQNLDGENRELLQQALQSGEIVLSEIHRFPHSERVYLDLYSPLYLFTDHRKTAVGVLVLRVDPSSSLFPTIQFWPTPSRTAETLMVRREGDEVVFLNELRHRRNPALSLRFPLSEIRLPAAVAARGEESVFEGMDYRGIPVIAATRRILNTSWAVVSKMDVEEIYAPIHRLARYVALLAGLLILSAGTSLGWIWRHQTAGFYRKQFEAELERQEMGQRFESQTRQLLQEMLDAAPFGAFVFEVLDNQRMVMLSANHSADMILKASCSQFLGRTIEEAFPALVEKGIPAAFRKVALTGEPLDIETVEYADGGIRFVFEVHVIKTGTRRIVVFFADITERQRADQERASLIQQLEARNTELERFTYTVSHDLKSPLITIKGFLGMLKRDVSSGNQQRVEDDLQRIGGAADKMAALMEDLLELSRIGRVANPFEEVPFSELVRDALELIAGRITERGVEVDIASDLPVIYGDRHRLIQVLQNLIDNAVKFMGDEPQPRIQIEVRRNGRENTFVIRDNGIGIDPRYHDKVFGLFDKLSSKTEGTGIGLALVQRIIEVHEGKIWVESEGLGHGCAFCFTLSTSTRDQLAQ